MTIRVWPARKCVGGNSYTSPMKVIDEEKIRKIKEFCWKLGVGVHVMEDPCKPTTKIIITVPYKEEQK